MLKARLKTFLIRYVPFLIILISALSGDGTSDTVAREWLV